MIFITFCVKIASLFILGDEKKLIAHFFAQTKPQKYKKGEIVLRPDNLNPGVNFVEKGHIKVYSITEDGNEKVHVIFKSGAIFPLLWIFKDINRDVYYEALDEVITKKETRDSFVNFIKNDSHATSELISKLLTTMDVYIDRIDELEYTKSYPRLVSSLLTFAKHFGKKTGKRIFIDVPLTHKDIASSLNMTRETASRDLEKLIKKKLIVYKKHRIVINDLVQLKKELLLYPADGGIL